MLSYNNNNNNKNTKEKLAVDSGSTLQFLNLRTYTKNSLLPQLLTNTYC